MIKLLSPATVFIVSLLVITGCNASKPSMTLSSEQAATAGPSPITQVEVTDTPVPLAMITPVESPTRIPSSTPTATATETVLPTDTATVTLTAIPSRVQPGIYNVGNCVSYRVGWSLRIEFCVAHVEVLEDYSMIFTVSWTSYMSPEDLTVYKHSDKGNNNMYVTDNLGNRYDHFAVGGSAATYTKMINGGTVTGTFSFPPAAPGANTFTFHDDDNGVATHGIKLTTPIKVYDYLVLKQYPFRLRFPLKYWQVSTNTGGKEVLTHLTIKNCTMAEAYPATPQGRLINNLKVGQVTYNIYRYYGEGISVREYQAMTGVAGIDQDAPPLISVTIPLDNAQQCILDASEVLANLQPVQPITP